MQTSMNHLKTVKTAIAIPIDGQIPDTASIENHTPKELTMLVSNGFLPRDCKDLGILNKNRVSIPKNAQLPHEVQKLKAAANTLRLMQFGKIG